MNELARSDIKFLPGVGPQRAKTLESELQIKSFYDLLYYFPFRYVDRSTVHRICDLAGEMPYIQLRGRFIHFSTEGAGAKRRLIGLFSDGTGTMEVVWFNRVKWLLDAYSTGKEYLLFGKPVPFNRHYSMVHPEVDEWKENGDRKGLVGVYNLTDKMRQKGFSTRVMSKLVASLLVSKPVQQLRETLPRELVERLGLMPLRDALVNIHTPESIEAMNRAKQRLKFEELFFLQMNILRYVKGRNAQVPGHRMARAGRPFNEFYSNHLPFPLTGAQKRVIKEIWADFKSGRQMNRLLQGDVGSGKTVVAFMTALLAIGSGYQTCVMAPTEILATQHAESIGEMAKPLGLNVELLTGSTRKKERERIAEMLLSGELDILIGTHALIEDNVQWRNLGLAVIDEQHRFGVAQRAKLWKKNYIPPHVLVMTATPIPRTLAMTVYGDLDVSVIDELPPGRKPITTVLRHENNHLSVYHFIGQELLKGRQCYIVYPLIEESEKLDLRALEEGYEIVREHFPSYRVACVHGKMKPAEKEYQMNLFASGQAHILVATTVIEVGVNVPNASVMVIENAERFGLSQLHQLRGRVGRGADQSYCILIAKMQLSKDTRHRLEVMTQTNDGFVVAEEDMKQRGPGDLEGTQQSGMPFNLKIANLATDGIALQQARDEAQKILDIDPHLKSPQNQSLDEHLKFLFHKNTNWGLIS